MSFTNVGKSENATLECGGEPFKDVGDGKGFFIQLTLVGIFQLDLLSSRELCADFNESAQFGVGFRRFLISIRSVPVDITTCHKFLKKLLILVVNSSVFPRPSGARCFLG